MMAMLLAACAHSPANLDADIKAGDKRCASQKWATELAKVNCYNSEEIAVIKRDFPGGLNAFEDFNSKRTSLAEKVDDEIAPAKEHMNQYTQSENEAKAVLMAHEPQFAARDSQLTKDIAALNPASVCKSPNLVTVVKCMDAIGHPVWERDAPDTLKYYEEFVKTRLHAAKIYDATGSQKSYAAASAKYIAGVKKANEEFLADAKKILLEQQQTKNSQQLQQTQSAANALATLGAIKALMPPPLPVQPYVMPNSRDVMTSCTGYGNSINCTSHASGIDTSMYPGFR